MRSMDTGYRIQDTYEVPTHKTAETGEAKNGAIKAIWFPISTLSLKYGD